MFIESASKSISWNTERNIVSQCQTIFTRVWGRRERVWCPFSTTFCRPENGAV